MAKVGEALTIEDIEEILEAVDARQANFPDEPRDMTFMLVMLNIGDRYSEVECVNGEWTGIKKELKRRADGGVPLCPNGHPLLQGPGLKLGWLSDAS